MLPIGQHKFTNQTIPTALTFGNWDNKNTNENEKTTLLHVLASSCSISIWELTSNKLIAPFEGFPPYYKIDSAFLKKAPLFK